MLESQTRVFYALDIAARAGIPDPVLVTRPIGRLFAPVLDTMLGDVPQEAGIAIDFDGIEIMDGSFGDEVFGSMAAARGRRAARPYCIVLQGLSTASREDLEFALLSRPDREKSPGLRNCVFPILEDSQVQLVGKAENHVRETFEVLRFGGLMTARALADQWSIDIAAASTRLKSLFDLGLAARVETRDPHGKVFLYRWPW